jgi:hypothetical protein
MSSLPFQQCDGLSPLEQHYVNIYAGNIYDPLIHYLINQDTIKTYRSVLQEFVQSFYYMINNRPDLYREDTLSYEQETPVIDLVWSKIRSNDIQWFQNIMFQYTILLHEIILKCPIQYRQVDVHRGVLTHYLKEDTHTGYFLNSFTSTSFDKNRARSFSTHNNDSKIVYHFQVMKDVSCIYIGTDEDELLINIYQCYLFTKKEENHYYYIIYPLSITPPNNENEYSKFKRNVVTRSVAMGGGDIIEGDTIEYSKNKRNTRKSNRHNNQTTRKNMPLRKRIKSASERARERLMLPIATSSFGISLTPDMIAARDRYAKEIEERLKRGSYY